MEVGLPGPRLFTTLALCPSLLRAPRSLSLTFLCLHSSSPTRLAPLLAQGALMPLTRSFPLSTRLYIVVRVSEGRPSARQCPKCRNTSGCKTAIKLRFGMWELQSAIPEDRDYGSAIFMSQLISHKRAERRAHRGTRRELRCGRAHQLSGPRCRSNEMRAHLKFHCWNQMAIPQTRRAESAPWNTSRVALW